LHHALLAHGRVPAGGGEDLAAVAELDCLKEAFAFVAGQARELGLVIEAGHRLIDD
jgi:hypothetical protein